MKILIHYLLWAFIDTSKTALKKYIARLTALLERVIERMILYLPIEAFSRIISYVGSIVKASKAALPGGDGER